MSKPPKQVQTLPTQRDGEGWSVPVTLGVDAPGRGHMSADLSGLPVPAKRYTADIWAVRCSRETIQILFAQEKIGGGLRNLLIVNMAPINAVRMVRMSGEIEKPSLRDVARAVGADAEPQTPIGEEPAETVSLKATAAITAMTDRDANIDFFSASAFSVSVAVRSHKLALDPVVRIELRSGMLMGLINSLEEMFRTLPAKLVEENGHGRDE